MTTYTLTGIAVHRSSTLGQEDAVLGVTQNIQLQFVVPEGVTSFSYSLLDLLPGDDFRTADVSLNNYNERLTGSSFATFNDLSNEEVFFVDVASSFGNATVLGIYVEDVNVNGIGVADTDFIFAIEGTLPSITTPQQWNAFDNSIISVSNATGSFGPGVNIPLGSLGSVISQNDLIDGTPGEDRFYGGLGNDTISGGAGNDTLNGGAGNDFLNPGDNVDYDTLYPGIGNDTVSFANLNVGYAEILHSDLNAGISVEINGNTNTGTVNKGANGTTVLLDIANPIIAGNDNGGLGIIGTAFNDSFNVTSKDDGWMSVSGSAGNDTFTFGQSAGGLRLDYRDSDGTNGVVANLAAGLISNDGHGNTDTIQGPGRITELRTSMQSDNVVGTDGNDSFILMAGNDTLKAGLGFDRLRYDRNGVEAVSVDLSAETASGIWRGEAFIHTISGIEHVRGSREDNDMLRGDDSANRLEGRGGNDTLNGGGGSDSLEGGSGNDVIYGDGIQANLSGAVAGQVFRMYQATLDRAPDSAGYEGWVTGLSEGTLSLQQMARGFVRSAEFQNTYSSLDDAGFVNLLYQNVLGRAADAGGLTAWLDAIKNGTTREEVVLGFSQSAEFQRDTQEDSAVFALSQSEAHWSDEIYRVYRATLDRDPDLGGFQGWAELLGSGTAFDTMINGFVNSPEFRNTYGSLDDEGFVELLYQNVLDRAADTGGLQGWLDVLDGGGTRAQVVRGFSQSSEFQRDTAADLKAWVENQGTDDFIFGSSGTNKLSGGMLQDVFVFDAGENSSSMIQDFEVWDKVFLRGFGYNDAATFRTHVTQHGNDAVFVDQEVMITFANTQVDQIELF